MRALKVIAMNGTKECGMWIARDGDHADRIVARKRARLVKGSSVWFRQVPINAPAEDEYSGCVAE